MKVIAKVQHSCYSESTCEMVWFNMPK